MNVLYRVGSNPRRAMGFALLVVFLLLGAIGGCGDGTGSKAGVAGPTGPGGPDESGGFGGEEAPEVQTEGCNVDDQSKCIMVTFDDSLGPQYFTVLEKLYKDQKNQDNSAVRMTYFATVGFSASISNFDSWAAAGNEIANHTVSHFVKDGSEKNPFLFTKAKWFSEMKGLYEIVNHWTGITDHQNVVGFRQPFFFPGSTQGTQKMRDDWRAAYQDYLNYLTSNHPVGENGYGFSTETIFYFSNYASSGKESKETTITKENGFAPEHNVYNVTVPVLGKALAMELPVCGGNTKFSCGRPETCTLPTTAASGCLDWAAMDTAIAQGQPTVIALHPQEITAHPDFADWASEKRTNGYTFVTMSEAVYLYAQKKDQVSEGSYVAPEVYSTPTEATTCKVPGRPDGVAGSGPYFGYASQCRESADGNTCEPETNISVSNACDLKCEDADGNPNANYGVNCFANSRTPDANASFTTFYPCDKPNNFEKPTSMDWEPGSFPWLGNPTGNKVTGIGCNTFPENACQATNFSGKCAPPAPAACINPAPYPEWVTGGVSGITKNFCVTYEGKTYRCDAEKGFEADCNSFAPGSPAARGYWSPST